jgi:hypothetical protein
LPQEYRKEVERLTKGPSSGTNCATPGPCNPQSAIPFAKPVKAPCQRREMREKPKEWGRERKLTREGK